MSKLCIYHKNCLDGYCSAFIVNKFHHHYRDLVEFYPASYNDKDLPDVEDKEVFIVDFSYKRDILIELASKAKSIVVLDHHKTAEADLRDLNLSNVLVIFDMNRSGAMITWDYFYPDIEAPKLINHVQDHDLWQFKLEGTKEIICALFSYPFDFDAWDYMSRNLNQLYIEGCALLRDKMKDCGALCKHPQYLTIAGYKIPAVNCSAKYSSDIGNILSLDAPFAATYYIDKDFQVMFSLRSNKKCYNYIDVSEIAKQYNGGGHECAGGFTCDINKLLEFMND